MRKSERQGTAKTIKWFRKHLRLNCGNRKEEALTVWANLPASLVQQQIYKTREVLGVNHNQMAYAFRRVFGVGIDSIERIWEVQS